MAVATAIAWELTPIWIAALMVTGPVTSAVTWPPMNCVRRPVNR